MERNDEGQTRSYTFGQLDLLIDPFFGVSESWQTKNIKMSRAESPPAQTDGSFPPASTLRPTKTVETRRRAAAEGYYSYYA